MSALHCFSSGSLLSHGSITSLYFDFFLARRWRLSVQRCTELLSPDTSRFHWSSGPALWLRSLLSCCLENLCLISDQIKNFCFQSFAVVDVVFFCQLDMRPILALTLQVYIFCKFQATFCQFSFMCCLPFLSVLFLWTLTADSDTCTAYAFLPSSPYTGLSGLQSEQLLQIDLSAYKFYFWQCLVLTFNFNSDVSKNSVFFLSLPDSFKVSYSLFVLLSSFLFLCIS